MRILLSERENNSIEYGLIYGAIASFILLATYFITNILNLAGILNNFHCAFKTITHIPCLTCGMTRSTIQLAHLNVFESLRLNPLACLTITGLLIWALWSLINLALKSHLIKIELSRIEQKILIRSFVILILINWAYLIISKR